MGERTQISRIRDTFASLHEGLCAPEQDETTGLALIVLDRFGIVDNCNAAAGELFGGTLPGLLGRHVNGVIPGMPIRSGTPGYNIAYAAYWSRHASYRTFTGIDLRGNALDLDIRVDCVPVDGDPRIVLALRQPARADCAAPDPGGARNASAPWRART